MSFEELENIIHTYGRDLYSFCRFITHNRYEADDLYQDTFLKLYEIREKTVIEKNPKSYIMTISVNLYRNYKRKHAVRMAITGGEASVEDYMDVIASKDVQPDTQIVIQEEYRLLRAEINKLPDKYKLPLLLFYMEDIPLTEISKILKLPVGTVKTRLHRAKNILKRKLEQDFAV